MSVHPTIVRGQPSAAPKDYAQELGWKSKSGPTADSAVYSGYYRAAGLRYQGWVLQQTNGKLLFYILKPPISLLRKTQFAGCFHFRNDEWWLIGFRPDAVPADLAS